MKQPRRRAPAPTGPPPSKQPTRYIGLDTVKPGGFLVELDPDDAHGYGRISIEPDEVVTIDPAVRDWPSIEGVSLYSAPAGGRVLASARLTRGGYGWYVLGEHWYELYERALMPDSEPAGRFAIRYDGQVGRVCEPRP